MQQRSESVVFDAAKLDTAQLEGVGCVRCRVDLGETPSVPVGIVDGGQVFACHNCTDGSTPLPVRPLEGRGVDWNRVASDITAVLARYGLKAEGSVRLIEQGGYLAGVTMNAFRRPEELPPPPSPEQQREADRRNADRVFAELAARIEQIGGVA